MAKKKRRRKKNNQQGIATIIFVLALFVIGGGFGARYLIDNYLDQPTTTTHKSTGETAEQRHQHQFISKMEKPAVNVYKKNHQVLPSIAIAQAIVESNWGESQLYRQAKNPFGMKGSYEGKTRLFPTTEYVNGKEEKINAYFRVYPTLSAAILDHDAVVARQFLPSGVTNYRTAAKLLQSNGYATDPTYAKKLINVITTYNLNRFDSY
ncbi:glycoside hydrolase family 73 protein [Secundilactobacillus folii]|uniref:N-acetylmuramidase n=1 Tax=Secundilactobacillus folii TaxID=2678357 RepID=A0A7X3C2Q6_9LACO|nr:glucosaminidase domain-containing protein [Secundilactobacillus folii]MTV82092.1 N-acetylmuramidase [Secundilactobacillus folii]